MFYSMKKYRLLGYRKSKRPGKKYDAILKNVETGKLVYVPFGALGYQHYRDETGEKLYSHLDHNNPERKRRYLIRHKKDIRKGYYSPGYFSMYKLWKPKSRDIDTILSKKT